MQLLDVRADAWHFGLTSCMLFVPWYVNMLIGRGLWKYFFICTDGLISTVLWLFLVSMETVPMADGEVGRSSVLTYLSFWNSKGCEVGIVLLWKYISSDLNWHVSFGLMSRFVRVFFWIVFEIVCYISYSQRHYWGVMQKIRDKMLHIKLPRVEFSCIWNEPLFTHIDCYFSCIVPSAWAKPLVAFGHMILVSYSYINLAFSLF